MIYVILTLFMLALLVWRLKQYCRGGRFTGTRQDLKGKVAIVTGGGSGIGLQLTKDLAKSGCTVIIADIIDSNCLAQDINKGVGSHLVSYSYLDLGSLQSIKKFVSQFEYFKLDFLINNAGVMGLPSYSLTESKFQKHIGVNYIGHFYLTHLLWPKLSNSEFFRIIIVSSITHRKILGFGRQTTLQIPSLNSQSNIYNKDIAYARSKLCLTMFAKALSEIINPQKGLAISVHPGIVRSGITKHMFAGKLNILFQLISPFYWIFTKSCEQGIQTLLFALHSKSNSLKPGAFYSDCQQSWSNSYVEHNWKKLFEITQSLLGIQFGK